MPLHYNGIYGGYDVTLYTARYSNGRLAIRALDEDGTPAFTATVNLPDEHLNRDEVFIKDYAENEGVLEFLMDCGVVTEVVGYTVSGNALIARCKISEGRLAELT